MLKHARRSISEINSATERIAALRDPDSGTVRLAFLHSLASWLVPDLLRRFRSAAPRVQFTLSQAAAYEMVEFLAGGHVDLAITAPGLTEPGLDGASCRSSACASWFRAITALPSAPDCASPKPPTNRSSHWVRNSQCVQVSTLKALEGDPNWVASVEELIDYDRTEHVPTRTRARPDGSDTERMEVCQPVSEATPASW
jgi:DNA-binding transcriptional LysR family regulator